MSRPVRAVGSAISVVSPYYAPAPARRIRDFGVHPRRSGWKRLGCPLIRRRRVEAVASGTCRPKTATRDKTSQDQPASDERSRRSHTRTRLESPCQNRSRDREALGVTGRGWLRSTAARSYTRPRAPHRKQKACRGQAQCGATRLVLCAERRTVASCLRGEPPR